MKLPRSTPPVAGRKSSGIQIAGPRPSAPGSRPASAFTMIEIALCLAIIGFALVAIIGVLPIGLNVQKENREETIIDQDAAVWMDAIRNGSFGYDDLTNHVIAITNTVGTYTAAGVLVKSDVYVFTPAGSTLNGVDTAPQLPLANGATIIGLFSKPQIAPRPNSPGYLSNSVVACVRSLSGPAVEKFPQNNPVILGDAFSYRMVAEVTPYVPFDLNTTNFAQVGLSAPDAATRLNYSRVVMNLQTNSHSVRLLFRWPLLPNGNVGNGRQTFRTMVGGRLPPYMYNNFGQLVSAPDNLPFPVLTRLYFFQPSTYVKAP